MIRLDSDWEMRVNSTTRTFLHFRTVAAAEAVDVQVCFVLQSEELHTGLDLK